MIRIISIAIAMCTFTSCAIVPSNHGFALLGDTKEEFLATDEEGTRVGKACGKNYLGLVAVGDTSVELAKKNGGITSVATVDREIKRYIIISEYCTIVTGS